MLRKLSSVGSFVNAAHIMWVLGIIFTTVEHTIIQGRHYFTFRRIRHLVIALILYQQFVYLNTSLQTEASPPPSISIKNATGCTPSPFFAFHGYHQNSSPRPCILTVIGLSDIPNVFHVISRLELGDLRAICRLRVCTIKEFWHTLTAIRTTILSA